jgi:5-methylcytosine-specific restriction endonuclease McrA
MISYNPSRGSRENPVCQYCRHRMRERTCEYCGEKFYRYGAPRPGAPMRFCTAKCRVDSTRMYDDPRAGSKASTRARKLQHSLTWDGIEDWQIFQRDGWTCQVPGCELGPVRYDLAWPDPLSPSVDHIVPLSLGGTDTAPNKRAAHLTCNTRRGVRMHPDDVLVITPELAPLGLLSPRKRVKVPPELCAVCGTAEVWKSGATCADCKQAAAAERRNRVLALRDRGFSWAEIADICGLSGAGAAYNVAFPPWDRYRDRYKVPVTWMDDDSLVS